MNQYDSRLLRRLRLPIRHRRRLRLLSNPQQMVAAEQV
jgi:hypothetical protein